MLSQQSHAIKNQLGHSKPPMYLTLWIAKYFACYSLILYGIRAPVIISFRADYPYATKNQEEQAKWRKIVGASNNLKPRPMRAENSWNSTNEVGEAWH